jgi:hypothetical protein
MPRLPCGQGLSGLKIENARRVGPKGSLMPTGTWIFVASGSTLEPKLQRRSVMTLVPNHRERQLMRSAGLKAKVKGRIFLIGSRKREWLRKRRRFASKKGAIVVDHFCESKDYEDCSRSLRGQ